MSGPRQTAVALGLALATAAAFAPTRARGAPPRPVAGPKAQDAPPSDDGEQAPPGDETDDPAADDASGDAPGSDPIAEGSGDDANEDEADGDAPAPIPPEPDPRPRRYVWGGTDLDAQRATEAEPTTTASPDTGSAAPGGYLGATETKEVAPRDGERKLLVAYIVLPLGTLAMVSGAVATWLTHPDHCQERLGRYGSDVTPKQCRGLWILNIVRTTYGSMMIASGAVLLGLGLRERKRYREWKAKHGAYVQPWFSRGRGAATTAWGVQGPNADRSAGLVFGGRF